MRLFTGYFVGCAVVLLTSAVATGQDGFREVSFEASDGGRVFANFYAAERGDEESAVVLAHGMAFNKESWNELAGRLAKEGHRVLAIDFRGYGKSTAGREGRALDLDVLAAIKFLEENGAKRVSVVGGSMGGGAAATAATKTREGQIDRLVLLAGVPISNPGKIQGEKLFIVSGGDSLRARVEQQFDAAPSPKTLVVLDGDAHAQNIFRAAQAAQLTKLIVAWLGEKTDR
jgi:pimeloyl-ACP methyl ester carboxylesterase